MQSNFDQVKIEFYGCDFKSSFAWPTPGHAQEWVKDHYSYSLGGHPWEKYRLGITMIAGKGLHDRMAFQILQVLPANAQEGGFVTDAFQKGTSLVTAFEVEMRDLINEKSWHLYLLEHDMGIAEQSGGSERYGEILHQDAETVKARFAEPFEKKLYARNIVNLFKDNSFYPTIAPMLVDLFMEYRDARFEQAYVQRPPLRLVHSS